MRILEPRPVKRTVKNIKFSRRAAKREVPPKKLDKK